MIDVGPSVRPSLLLKLIDRSIDRGSGSFGRAGLAGCVLGMGREVESMDLRWWVQMCVCTRECVEVCVCVQARLLGRPSQCSSRGGGRGRWFARFPRPKCRTLTQGLLPSKARRFCCRSISIDRRAAAGGRLCATHCVGGVLVQGQSCQPGSGTIDAEPPTSDRLPQHTTTHPQAKASPAHPTTTSRDHVYER
jgi:hypothetical protein